MSDPDAPFAELPAALVEEVLSQTASVGERLLESFQQAKDSRKGWRQTLVKKGYIIKESTLGCPSSPTTCATDGSYAMERLLTVDLAAAAAVAMEGLTPPSEQRHWDQPRHSTIIYAEPHQEKTVNVLRAAMIGEELILACKAPHDLVMLDCTLTLPIIYFNQGISAAKEHPELHISGYFVNHVSDYLDAYRTILMSKRSDKQFIGNPKYSTRREIGEEMGWEGTHDDRGLLTLVLEAGELTKPMSLQQTPGQTWHLGTNSLPEDIKKEAKSLADDIVAQLENVYVFYYKPHDWLPALRIESAQDVAKNKHRLAIVVQGVKYQCATPSMLEPYPLYLADRTVKALVRALPAFRHVTTQRIAEQYGGDIGEVFFAMHGYRSEGGR